MANLIGNTLYSRNAFFWKGKMAERTSIVLKALKTNKLLGDSILVFLTAFLFYVVLTSDCMPINGDTAAYNQQIDDLDLSERTVHWGHMAIGIVWSRLLPLSTDWSMNILGSIFGAIGVTAAFLITYKITKDKISSLAAAAILLVAKTYWQSSVFSEAHLTQTALTWLSFTIWIYNKGDILAGICFLFAVIIR